MTRILRFLFSLLAAALCASDVLAFMVPRPDNTISNVRAVARTDGVVEITYDHAWQPYMDTVRVALRVSSDGGRTYSVPVRSVSGDIGNAVAMGIDRKILWNASMDFPGSVATGLAVEVRSCNPAQWTGGDFAKIPAGTYRIGNVIGDVDLRSALPRQGAQGAREVTLGEYSMAVNLTTLGQWEYVRRRALALGYTDLDAGSGKGPDHPVYCVRWHEVVKWLNAASELDGLRPCYSVGGAVFRTGGKSNVPNTADWVSCDWNASGYRLPTEAEWEVAARGGLEGKRFPWGDDITHAQTTYQSVSVSVCPYDKNPTPGKHPSYSVDPLPYTSPVGSFACNGYGLNDMVGNMYQWCWDFGSAGFWPTYLQRMTKGGYGIDRAEALRLARRQVQRSDGYSYSGFRAATTGSSSAQRSSVGTAQVAPDWAGSVGASIKLTYAWHSQSSQLGVVGGKVVVSYGFRGGTASIGLDVSLDGGATWITPSGLSGDIGPGVTPGDSKRIEWDPVVNYPGRILQNVKVRVRAWDAQFVNIPAGNYMLGDGGYDRRLTPVTLSQYYVAKYVTTKAQWNAVRPWATQNGYTFTSNASGKADDHPVHSVSWNDAVKWANAASEIEGLVPCYRVRGAVYRTGGDYGLTCDWNANGYRLPTEAEWEIAARGGLSGIRFPWGSTISHSQANYLAHWQLWYDNSRLVNDYNPAYKTGSMPYTNPVGSFAANGYGLFGMAGNVSQWCWDWYSMTYSGGSDPKGPDSGLGRIRRGGSWAHHASAATCAFRIWWEGDANNNGFRLVGGAAWGERSSLVSSGSGTVVASGR